MQKKVTRNIKWIFDKTISLTGLIALSPVFASISVVIKFESPGLPIFFRQARIGQYGKPFCLVKFRNMRPGENDKSQHITVAGDPRITRIGRFLRKYKLDELPQLWNVLKGDMSFVGPRPDVAGYADKLEGDDRIILTLKPGITCPATIKYRNEEELLARQPDPKVYNDTVLWPDKVRLNREYAKNNSFWGDLKIILQTIRVLKVR